MTTPVGRRRWLVVLAFLAGVALFAYFAQDVIRYVFLQPLSYLWWQVNILYKSVAQIVYWALLVVLVLGVAASSLLVRPPQQERRELKRRIERGPLEEMSWWLAQSQQRGTYFKWRVAHRLAELAVRVVARDDLSRSLPAEKIFSGKDWSPDPEVQQYLVAGLERQLVAPGRTLFFGMGPRTQSPYDIEVERVIAYLESRMELNRDRES